jgi:tetrahydromethanopterin S-methyltransferase subunit C
VASTRRSRFYTIWYLCISVGFVLLGIRALLVGEPRWAVILRCMIAAGFLALAWVVKRR